MGAPAGAMVLSNNQQGNFGGYGGQYNMGGGGTGTMGQQQQTMMEQQQPPPAPPIQNFGGMHQQNFTQPPAQQYGQQVYGMQQPIPYAAAAAILRDAPTAILRDAPTASAEWTASPRAATA